MTPVPETPLKLSEVGSIPHAAFRIPNSSFILVLTLVVSALSVLGTRADWDLWHRLAVGRIFHEQHRVLLKDVFAYTPTKDVWIDHEWASGVLFHELSLRFGDAGLIGLKTLLLLGVMLSIRSLHRLVSPERAPESILFSLVVLIALMPGFGSTIRCQTFTYFFFSAWLVGLEHLRRGHNIWILLFPVSALAWVNLHGGFLAGLGFMGVYAAGEILYGRFPARILIAIALTIPVTFITPYGLEYWPYLIEAASMKRPGITEWRSLDLLAPMSEYGVFRLLLVATVCAFVSAARRKTLDRVHLLAFLVTLSLAVNSRRHMIFCTVVMASFAWRPLIASLDWFRMPRIPRAVSIVLPTLAAASSVYVLATSPLKLHIDESAYPVKAVEFIRRQRLEGNLLVPFNWGSYALWHLYPQCRVSIDGRFEECYPTEVYHEVSDFTFATGDWDAVLRKYPNDIILIKTGSETDARIRQRPEWREAYSDIYATVYVKSG